MECNHLLFGERIGHRYSRSFSRKLNLEIHEFLCNLILIVPHSSSSIHTLVSIIHMVAKKLISKRGNDFLKKFSSTVNFYSNRVHSCTSQCTYRILSSVGFLIILPFSKILIQCYVNCTVQNRRESRELKTELNAESNKYIFRLIFNLSAEYTTLCVHTCQSQYRVVVTMVNYSFNLKQKTDYLKLEFIKFQFLRLIEDRKAEGWLIFVRLNTLGISPRG